MITEAESASAGDSEGDYVTQLHGRGWVEIADESWLSWDVCMLIQSYHDKYNSRVSEMLERLRPTWQNREGGARPGAHTAYLVTQEFEKEGIDIIVTATHPCEAKGGEPAQPRFYASIVSAVLKRGAYCTRPPDKLARILWPAWQDKVAPWITEMGWTCVPASSPRQEIHADIVRENWKGCDSYPRKKGSGRFHHISWKADAQQHCTTQVVSRAFTEGEAWREHYDALRPVGARCIIFDSEMLHCGGPTSADKGWSSTCTLQIVSTSGWPALNTQGRCSPDLLPYTLPITPLTGDRVALGKHQSLLQAGYTRLALQELHAMRWGLPELIQSCFEQYNKTIVSHLSACRSEWNAVQQERPGTLAALEVSAKMAAHGITIFAGPPSQSQRHPFRYTGPRFYVSILNLALRQRAREQSEQIQSENHEQTLHEAFQVPLSLARMLWGENETEIKGIVRVRSLGWVLAPPASDPQILHADLWVRQPMRTSTLETGYTRHKQGSSICFPHLLWKEQGLCNTEVVPRGFTCGEVSDHDFDKLVKVSTPVAIVDGEMLHRGAAVPHKEWAVTLSIELISPSGGELWDAREVEGTENPGDGSWEMLNVAVAPEKGLTLTGRKRRKQKTNGQQKTPKKNDRKDA